MKGLLMLGLFGVFLLGIFFELLIILPVLWVLNRILGPQPCRMQWTISILVSLWLLLLRACGLLKVRELKGKPFDGPCVIVSNHPGLFDVLFLIRDIPRMSVMVKQALARKLPLGPVFRSAGYVLSPDFEQRGPFQSMDEAIEKIDMGYKFMIFPEATRSPKETWADSTLALLCLQGYPTSHCSRCLSGTIHLFSQRKTNGTSLPPGSQPSRSNSGSLWPLHQQDRNGSLPGISRLDIGRRWA